LSKDLTGKRFLVGPVDIAGFGSRIAGGLADGGASVLLFNAQSHVFNPPCTGVLRSQRLFAGPVAIASRLGQKGIFGKIAGAILTSCVKVLAFSVACTWADVCVFIGGKGILTHSAEYVFLKLLGKRVIHIFVGTASRPRYMSGYATDTMMNGSADEKRLRRLVRRTRRQARRVRGIARRASIVVENPLCGQFHERPFINYFKIGIPLSIEQLEQNSESSRESPRNPNEKLIVLHCPSQPEMKGSSRIRSAVDELVSEGLRIEFRQLSGIPHSQVLREITRSDFVVDQLFSDTQMAGFAAEASALGKAAIVGGYGWNLINRDLESSEIPPTSVCHPDDVGIMIRKLADAEARSRSGDAARRFLAGQWSGAAFASRFARLVSGEIPPQWWIKPDQVRYMHGCGIEESEVRRIIGAMVDRFGPGALQVEHNPALRDLMITFASGEKAPY
jgi:hypothetical protein